MSGKYDKSFLEHLCDYEQGWRVLFLFSAGFLLVSLAWFVSVEAGTPTYAVTVLNLVGLSVLAVLSAFVLRHCG